MRVGVVGAGICGVSAGRFLAERGHSVTLFEQFDFLHRRGSSHGRSRIVRRAYPDALYTMYAAEAYPLWGELQAKSRLPILHECGLLYFGSADSRSMVSMAKGLEELGVPFESLDSSSVGRVMPALRLAKGEVAVYTPEAGWVHAQRALMASSELATDAGAELVFGKKVGREELERDFDAFVVCAGSWVREFVDLDVKVTKQTFCYFGGHLEGPVWIEDSVDNAYGFPSEIEHESFKVGIHCGGVPIDPEDGDREADLGAIGKAKDAARRRFGFLELEVVESSGCLYTSTESEDFRLGRIGEKGFYSSACSGHGFKFGPWIGKLLADFVERRDQPERYPRFLQS